MKFQMIFGGIILLILGIFSSLGFKTHTKMSGWREPSSELSLFYLIVGLFFVFFGFKYKTKNPEFTRCKKCKKVYNFSDTKDMICPKCGGKLQDYAEFEKEQEKQDEFKEAEKFQEEWIKQIKEERKKK
ncbi:adenylate kinase [Campylobacter sp. JMF_06 NA1]|uniref:adenylate kinase n=1 Tax=Campylobacter sp. JMF_06 NA1 TaxID=2983823 RepID=UPI0022EA07C8|nr:adenylate kinase [Campylobacter sp. JMF_06 NA1]MDA3078350.1 adenylate kinase [Campylobacter sp. JMF_06 NA1]